MIPEYVLDACYKAGKDGEDIIGFQAQFRIFSNFYPCDISYGGHTFPSVENAYQASKYIENKDYVEYMETAPPNLAKKKSRSIYKYISKTWRNDTGIYIMRNLVLQKFTTYDDMMLALISTRKVQIIEANSWNDMFYGVDFVTFEGENNLGKIIMHVREMAMDIAKVENGKVFDVASANPEDVCPYCHHGTLEHPHVTMGGLQAIRRCDQFVKVRGK
jgi:ribA/ribD-fused uncharacterized protein